MKKTCAVTFELDRVVDLVRTRGSVDVLEIRIDGVPTHVGYPQIVIIRAGALLEIDVDVFAELGDEAWVEATSRDIQ